MAAVGSGEGGKALVGGWQSGTGTVLVRVVAGGFRVEAVLNRCGMGFVGRERLVVVLVVRGCCVRAGCGWGLVWVWGCRLGWFGLCGCVGERIFWRRRCRVGSHNVRGGRSWARLGRHTAEMRLCLDSTKTYWGSAPQRAVGFLRGFVCLLEASRAALCRRRWSGGSAR